MRRIALILTLCFMPAIAGCVAFVDSDERRLCRSLLPALEPAAKLFDIVRVDDLTAEPAAGTVLRLAYRAYATAAERQQSDKPPHRIRTTICSFAPGTAKAMPVLTSVVSDRGPLGPARLHILQRYWVESGLAASADPAPVAVLTGAPEIPRNLAIGLQQALGSLPVIAIYALLAIAYALIYGLIGRINLAFGDLASLAGYGAFLGFSMIGDGRIGLAVATAFVVGLFTAAMHGGALGNQVIGRLAHAPGQHILIATIGVSIAWQEAMRLTQGTGNRWISPLMNRPLGIARAGDFIVTLTPMALVVAAVAACVAWAIVIAMRRLRFGLKWRACADDPIAAAMLGIDQGAILARTMVLAALLSGLGGVLTTLYYGGVGYAGGLVIGLKALIAAIVGGIGSIHGALAGALLVGLTEALWSAVLPLEYRDPLLFVGLVLVLWLKPSGLYGHDQQPTTKRP